jgi:hypothetical protein
LPMQYIQKDHIQKRSPVIQSSRAPQLSRTPSGTQ